MRGGALPCDEEGRREERRCDEVGEANALLGPGEITRAGRTGTRPSATRSGTKSRFFFYDAIVDLQTSGPLAGAWAGTITFDLKEPFAKNTQLTLDVRGSVSRQGSSFAVVVFEWDGHNQSKRFKRRGFTWRVVQTLTKGVTTHMFTLLLAA